MDLSMLLVLTDVCAMYISILSGKKVAVINLLSPKLLRFLSRVFLREVLSLRQSMLIVKVDGKR
ncbi:MAG: hypothetical protein V3U52_06015 [Thermoplasmata archaeon]